MLWRNLLHGRREKQPKVYEALIGENWNTSNLRDAKSVGLETCIKHIDVEVLVEDGTKYLLHHKRTPMIGWSVSLYAPTGGKEPGGEPKELDGKVATAIAGVVNGEVGERTGWITTYQNEDYFVTDINTPREAKTDLGKVADNIDKYKVLQVDKKEIVKDVMIKPMMLTDVYREAYNNALKKRIPLQPAT